MPGEEEGNTTDSRHGDLEPENNNPKSHNTNSSYTTSNSDGEMAQVISVGDSLPLPHHHDKGRTVLSLSMVHTTPKTIPFNAKAMSTMTITAPTHPRTSSKVLIHDTIAAIKRKQKVMDMKKFTGGGPHL